MEQTKRLAKSTASQTPLVNINNSIKPGYVDERETAYNYKYHDVIKECRRFYHFDPLAGTVVSRLADISITDIRNRRKNKNSRNAIPDDVLAYYNYVAVQLKPFLKQLALEYVINGMVIAEYTTEKKMGNRATDKLGRTKYHFPKSVWCRNVDNIELVKLPTGADRVVYLKIPQDEIRLIKDGPKKDVAQKELYDYLLENFPEYVAAIKRGETKFRLTNIHPIYRKLTSYNVYPLPYLINALDPLKHKQRLKQMDMSITARIIEAVRQIKVGNDEFPADDEDLKAEQVAFTAYANAGERVFNYFTNHTIEVVWSYPPFERLLDDGKYREPNTEILFALGFPRIWINGETEKSNSSDNSLASAGPLATMNDIRDTILLWVKWFYEQLAELNNFTRVPEPYFAPFNFADLTTLIQYASEFYDKGAISLETMAALYGEEWETQQANRDGEEEIKPEDELETQQNNNTNNVPLATNTNTGTNQNDSSSTDPVSG